jgi:hypothetical protein
MRPPFYGSHPLLANSGKMPRMRQSEYRKRPDSQTLTVKKEIIREYTILFQYLLLLKEPTYIFLTQILQHLSPITWWEDFIELSVDRTTLRLHSMRTIEEIIGFFNNAIHSERGYLSMVHCIRTACQVLKI